MIVLAMAALSVLTFVAASGFIAMCFWQYRMQMAAALRGDIGEAIIVERPLTANPLASAPRPVRRSAASAWGPLPLAA